jgi:hypothetical protein
LDEFLFHFTLYLNFKQILIQTTNIIKVNRKYKKKVIRKAKTKNPGYCNIPDNRKNTNMRSPLERGYQKQANYLFPDLRLFATQRLTKSSFLPPLLNQNNLLCIQNFCCKRKINPLVRPLPSKVISKPLRMFPDSHALPSFPSNQIPLALQHHSTGE